MKTIKLQFKSEGKTIKKTAIISDDLETLSESKRNQAFDIINDFSHDEGWWALVFDYDKPGNYYEVQFKYDKEEFEKTLEPVQALTWNNEYIVIDAQFVDNITVK